MSTSTPDSFWSIISQSRGEEPLLESILHSLTRDQIVQFYHDYRQAVAELCCEPYTNFISNVSEDNLSDIAENVVSHGKEYYEGILQHPAHIPPGVPMNSPSFKGVTLNVFWDRFGETIPL